MDYVERSNSSAHDALLTIIHDMSAVLENGVRPMVILVSVSLPDNERLPECFKGRGLKQWMLVAKGHSGVALDHIKELEYMVREWVVE